MAKRRQEPGRFQPGLQPEPGPGRKRSDRPTSMQCPAPRALQPASTRRLRHLAIASIVAAAGAYRRPVDARRADSWRAIRHRRRERVRGYLEREIIGDRGVVGSVEATHPELLAHGRAPRRCKCWASSMPARCGTTSTRPARGRVQLPVGLCRPRARRAYGTLQLRLDVAHALKDGNSTSAAHTRALPGHLQLLPNPIHRTPRT